MKFAAKTNDLSDVEGFTRIVNTVSRLAKESALRIGADRLCFLRSSGNNKMWCELLAARYFDDFRLEGWSTTDNEIIFELASDELYQALRSTTHAASLKLKLTKKNNVPYLTVEIKLSSTTSTSRMVTHDVPIRIIQPRFWPTYGEPDVPNFDVSIFLPAIKTVQKVVGTMKLIANYVTVSASAGTGDMTLHIENDSAEVTTYFKNVSYAEWSEENGDSSQTSQKRRLVAVPSSQGSNRAEKNDKEMFAARVDIKTLSQFLISQQMTQCHLIMNIVNKRMLHFYIKENDLQFQYFLPSVEE